MRTCSRCATQSPDSINICPTCQADLNELSVTALALKKLRENPRVKAVRISVADDSCPACQKYQGAYPKNEIPALPIEGCSHVNGCRCFYDPILEEIYP